MAGKNRPKTAANRPNRGRPAASGQSGAAKADGTATGTGTPAGATTTGSIVDRAGGAAAADDKAGAATSGGRKAGSGKPGGGRSGAGKPGGGKAGATKPRGGRPGAGKSGGGRPGSAKQRARAAKAVAAARQRRSRRNTMIVTIAACAAIVVVLIGAVVYGIYRANEQKTHAIDAASVRSTVPVKMDHGTILAGRSNAPITIDIYEDFLCPFCNDLETANGKRMLDAMNDGQLRIRYRIVDLLNDSSNPAGYSRRAANAAFASVASGTFLSYHRSLYNDQPKEGSPGYSNDQLLSLGKRLGISGAAYDTFARHVRANTYGQYADQQLNVLANAASLRDAQGNYGTPTVLYRGKKLNVCSPSCSSTSWLTNLLNNNS